MTSTARDERLRRAHRAVVCAFVSSGLLSGTWVARIPDVKAALHLSDGALGTVFLFGSLGVSVAMAPVSRVVGRYGSGPVAVAGTAVYASLALLLGLARSSVELTLVLFIMGLAIAAQDVAMNSHAVALEHALERRILSVLHATWSVGALAGAGLGGLLAQWRLSTELNFVCVSAAVLVLTCTFGRHTLPGSFDRRGARERRSWSIRRAVPWFFVAFGLFGLCEQIGEGAASNWGSVLASDTFHAVPFVATLPYFLFSIAMVVGRFRGDALAERFGARRVLISSGVLTAMGLSVGMALNSLAGEVMAWVVMGLGSSSVLPLLFSEAGKRARSGSFGSMTPASALAIVTAIAYSGYLVGPPSIGWVAEATSLRLALLIPAALAGLYAGGIAMLVRE